jgi:hypothetical protein
MATTSILAVSYLPLAAIVRATDDGNDDDGDDKRLVVHNAVHK